jgi:hypothetical protein
VDLPQLFYAATDPLVAYAQGRSPKWPALSRAWLREFPLCAACGRPHGCVPHHVVPFHADPDRELDRDNLITLGESGTLNCHLWVGHAGNWRDWNPSVRMDAAHFAAMLAAARRG